MSDLIIVGFGKMGQSITKGLKNKNKITIVSSQEEIVKEKSEEYKTHLIYHNRTKQLDINNKKVIFCIKGDSLELVSKKIVGEARFIISTMAHTSLEEIKERIKSKHYIKAIPNIAVETNNSLTTYYTKENHSEEVKMLLKQMGKYVEVETEEELNNLITNNSSMIAYIAEYMSYFEEMLKDKGLNEKDIELFSKQLIDSYSELRDKYSNEKIKEKITTEGGVTQKGLENLKKIEKEIKKTFK